jgi:Rrf2 family transcriptional regulator, iron-sulfur cluster assembly transcription factor
LFRLYSKGCEYTIRALVHVASTDGRERFQAKVICDAVGIPEPFTRKVLQSLVQGGFLEAARGPGGGYALTEDPSRVSLLAIILAVDGKDTFDRCILGLRTCGTDAPCPLHETWTLTKEHLLAQLESLTLGDLVAAGNHIDEERCAG